ncbi:radical SAM protein [Streptomyces anulatus]
MRDQYGTEAVTLLGGEPFVHRDLAQVVRHAKEEPGLRVEICTNGYRIERRLTEIAPYLDLLRVSLEGVGSTNDGIRKQGSYQSALNALGLARDLCVPTGATMTVTSRNIAEVLPLGRALAQLGSRQLKLHHLRPVGNAADHPELLVTSPPGAAPPRGPGWVGRPYRARSCSSPMPRSSRGPAARRPGAPMLRRVLRSPGRWGGRAQAPHAYIGLGPRRLRRGPIHRTLVHRCPQQSQQSALLRTAFGADESAAPFS